MTQAQKIAKEKFKKAIAYRKKTGASLKEAFAFVYGKKVSAVKKKAASKKVAGNKKVGALPIDFKGNFLGYRFKVLNQYQLDGGVTAQFVEIDGKGDIIAELSGSTKENDRAAAVLYSGGLATGKELRLDAKDKKDLEKRIKSFVVGLNKEVAAYNSGKDTSKKKSKGLKIVYKPETKKLAVVDQIKSILKSNKKILKGGYTLKTGVIREKKVAGIDVKNIMSGVDNIKKSTFNEIEKIKKLILEQSELLERLQESYKKSKIKINKELIMMDIKTLKYNFIPNNKRYLKTLQNTLKKSM